MPPCVINLLPQIDPALVGLEDLGVGLVVIAQDQICGVNGEFGRGGEAHILLGEGAHHQNPLPAVLTGVDIELLGVLEMLFVIAVTDAA